MALDPKTGAFLAQLGELGFKPFHQSTPAECRAGIAALCQMNGQGPEMAKVSDHTVSADTGSFKVRVLVPKAEVRGIIMYTHGGGFVCGTLDDFETVARRLAARTRCAVVMVDYRLAPEHRFPAAADDAYAALLWANERKQEIAGRNVPFLLVGDSAGGNLAAVTTLRARDRKGPEIAFQALIYPVTDASLDYPSYTNPDYQLLISREDMVWFWDQYAPDVARRSEPDVSPQRAKSLAGLPPALIITAEYDVTRDDSERYAQRLKEAGVPVELSRYAGETHGFFAVLSLPGADLSLEQIGRAIDRRLSV